MVSGSEALAGARRPAILGQRHTLTTALVERLVVDTRALAFDLLEARRFAGADRGLGRHAAAGDMIDERTVGVGTASPIDRRQIVREATQSRQPNVTGRQRLIAAPGDSSAAHRLADAEGPLTAALHAVALRAVAVGLAVLRLTNARHAAADAT